MPPMNTSTLTTTSTTTVNTTIMEEQRSSKTIISKLSSTNNGIYEFYYPRMIKAAKHISLIQQIKLRNALNIGSFVFENTTTEVLDKNLFDNENVSLYAKKYILRKHLDRIKIRNIPHDKVSYRLFTSSYER